MDYANIPCSLKYADFFALKLSFIICHSMVKNKKGNISINILFNFLNFSKHAKKLKIFFHCQKW